MRTVVQQYAEDGRAIPAEVVPSMCSFLKLLTLECERMEFRLAGNPLEDADEPTGNVVSLAAWTERKGAGHGEH